MNNFVLNNSSDPSSFPRFRIKNGVVEVAGAVSPPVITGSTTETYMFRLPQVAWPAAEKYKVCQGSANAKWMFHITQDGYGAFSRYSDSNGYANTSTSNWLPFEITYLVK